MLTFPNKGISNAVTISGMLDHHNMSNENLPSCEYEARRSNVIHYLYRSPLIKKYNFGHKRIQLRMLSVNFY